MINSAITYNYTADLTDEYDHELDVPKWAEVKPSTPSFVRDTVKAVPPKEPKLNNRS